MSDKLNLIETIAKHDKFSTFTRLMASSGTNGIFDKGGDFTVFVPTNDAFAKVPERKINELLNETNQTQLKAMLSYHILSGKVMAGSLGAKQERRAFSGEDLTFSDTNGLKVNGASIQARNIEATNGVVHAVDTVLAPFSTPTRASTAIDGKPASLAAVPTAARAATLTPISATAVAETSVTGSAIPVKAGVDTKPLI